MGELLTGAENFQIRNESAETEQEPRRPFFEKLDRQRQFRNPPALYATDIHNTYWMVFRDKPGDDEKTIAQRNIRRQRFTEATLQVRQTLEANSVPAVAITAIDLEELTSDPVVSPDLSTDSPSHFDAIFTANGTEFFIIEVDENGKPAKYVPDPDYNKYIEEDIGYKREPVYDACLKLRQTFQGTEAVAGTHTDWNMVFQDRDTEENVRAWKAYDQKVAAGEQNVEKPTQKRPQPHKISYDINFPKDTPMSVVNEAIKTELTKAGFDKIHAVMSYAHDIGTDRQQFYVDVIPVTKGDAINYLREKYGTLVIGGGDSRNDYFLLKEAGGVVVGAQPNNKAHEELLDEIDRLPNLEKRNRFATFEDEATHSTQLLYIEPGDKEGPETILKAIRAYKLLELLRTKSQLSQNTTS